MRIVRVYDPLRQPRDWAELVQPHEYVVFASQIERGAPARHPTLRLDVFDPQGRSRPPLLTTSTPRDVGHSHVIRRQRVIAAALILAAPILFWVDRHAGLLGLPTLAGLNALVFAGRLLQLASAYDTGEHGRVARVAEESRRR